MPLDGQGTRMVQSMPGLSFEYRDRFWIVRYSDSTDFSDLPKRIKVAQVYGVCFNTDGQLLIGLGPRNRWALLGGTPRPREDWEGTLARKIEEEANMRVLRSRPIGFQVLTGFGDHAQLLQLRAYALVAPIRPFEPSEAVQEIKFINPQNVTKYFDWGNIGAHIVKRGLVIHTTP